MEEVATKRGWRFILEVSAGVLGVLGVLVSVIYYMVKLEDRLGALDGRLAFAESQLKLLASAPAITRETEGGSMAKPESIPNPLIATCSDLVKRAVAARSSPTVVSGAVSAIEGYMRDFGCADAMKNAGKAP